jgi:exopolysaccharide production protein ExoQ
MVSLSFLDRAAPSIYLRDSWATFYVALSTIILGYGGLLGPISIIVFLGMWLRHIPFRGPQVVAIHRLNRLLLLFLAWALLSASWSKYPSHSLYSALEYISLVACTIVISNVVTIRAFLRGLALGAILVLLSSLLWGRYATDPFSGRASLVGLFGSKNVVGLYAELLLLSVLLLLPMTKGIIKRAACSLPAALALFCLLQSKSATSMLSLIIAITVVAGVFLISKLPRKMRAICFIGVATWGSVLAGAFFLLGLHENVLRFFGKSTTLTGRTFLWDKGLQYGSEHFLHGGGYGAFWVQGNIPAENLWYKFGIEGRTGFHFHNLLVQSFVDLGLIGATLIGLIVLWSFFSSVFAALRHGMRPELAMAVAFSSMFVVRTYAEVDVLGTYSIGPMIFYSILPRLKHFAGLDPGGESTAHDDRNRIRGQQSQAGDGHDTSVKHQDRAKNKKGNVQHRTVSPT